MSVSTHDPHQKVRAEHLQRDAYLYIRQSTIHQVFHNTESTQRQYALKQRAIALGWPSEQVVIIDGDQGHSGASAVDREGFQRLVAEVGMGRAGIVLGLEVSRLARNNSDWHRLLEICGLTGTLILDEDGLYDPGHFNDRLLLGLKGTMSEAELHVLRARLQGGILSKARRGELRIPLPVGLVYDAQEKVILDPDRQVQQALRTFFEVYRREGSALAVVKFSRKNDLSFPRRLRGGQNKGQLVWGSLCHTRAVQVLRNPRYAGAYVYGRMKATRRSDGRYAVKAVPQENWHTLIPDAHPGYITWQQYQDNLRTLQACGRTRSHDCRKSPPGQGPALLQGLVVCGICGRRMTVRYHVRHGVQVPGYNCQHEAHEHGRDVCQSIPGHGIDQAIGEMLLEMVEPMTLELAFAVQSELQARIEEVDQLRRQDVQRAQYEADRARDRFMQVDPGNRLVADALEADWNERLRTLTDVREQYEQQRQKDRLNIDDASRQQVLALAQDLPKLWSDPNTRDQDRKRIVRLLIEDVTLIKAETIQMQIRFRGGATRTLHLPLPLSAWKQRTTPPKIIRLIDQLLDEGTDSYVARELNRRGLRSGMKQTFTTHIVGRLRRQHQLASRYDRLRRHGLRDIEEMAAELGVCRKTINTWYHSGLLKGYPYNNKGDRLYELPPKDRRPQKQQGQVGNLDARARYTPLPPHAANKVQLEQ